MNKQSQQLVDILTTRYVRNDTLTNKEWVFVTLDFRDLVACVHTEMPYVAIAFEQRKGVWYRLEDQWRHPLNLEAADHYGIQPSGRGQVRLTSGRGFEEASAFCKLLCSKAK